MPFPITVNGVEYTDASFASTGYLSSFPGIIADMITQCQNSYTGTSSTSVAMGTGSKTFTTQTGKNFAVGQPLTIARTSAPATTYMDGRCTAYDQVTGSITVDVTAVSGSGTYNNWTISLGGSRSQSGTIPAPLTEGGTGATSASQALTNLGVSGVAATLVGQTSQALMRTTGLGVSASVDPVLTAASLSAARTALGAGATGSSVFTAADTASAQSALGLANSATVVSTTTGQALMTASSASAARSALSLGNMATASESSQAEAEDGVVGTSIMTPRRVKDAVDFNLPVGVVFPFAGTSAPSGYLFCAGQAVSRTTYATLFGVVGTTYGSGDGSTTFNLPDLRGRVVAGDDNMGGTAANRLTSGGSGITGTTVGAAGGSETATLTEANGPPHDHLVLNSAQSGGTAVSSSNYVYKNSNQATGNNDYILQGGASAPNVGLTSESGSGTPFSIVQPTLVLSYIIKAV